MRRGLSLWVPPEPEDKNVSSSVNSRLQCNHGSYRKSTMIFDGVRGFILHIFEGLFDIFGGFGVVSARFVDASMYRDTCHAIRIAIQLGRIAIFLKGLTTPREINCTIYKVDRD